MSCTLQRNEKGAITEVFTKSGSKSELFRKIHAVPFLGSPELSARITAQISSKDSNDTYLSGEPKMYFRTGDNSLYEDLEDIFADQKQGNLSLGFKDKKNNFQTVATFSTDNSDTAKFFSNQIEQGVMSVNRVLDDKGVTHLKGKGLFPETIRETAKLLEQNLIRSGLVGTVRRNDLEGTVAMKPFNNSGVFLTKNGLLEEINVQDIPSRVNDIQDLPEALQLYYNSKKEVAERATQSDIEDLGQIGVALNNFLSTLGFSTTTLEAYRKRYNTLYGKDPDIKAMADLANRVVAFANGQITKENLSEEVAHIALEAYTQQESIDDVLINVHQTEEYQEFADYYRQKYAPFYEGVELEDQVRKEVMGKILGKVIQGKLTQTTSVSEWLSNMFNNLMKFIKSKLRGYHVKELDDLNERIANAIIRNDISMFDTDLNNSSKFFYSASSSEVKSLIDQVVAAKREIEDTKSYDPTIRYQAETLREINNTLNLLETIEGAATIIGIFDQKVSTIKLALERVRAGKGKRGTHLTDSERRNAQHLKDVLDPRIATIEAELKKVLSEEKDTKVKRKLQKTIDGLLEVSEKATQNLRKFYPEIDADAQQKAEEFLSAELETIDITEKDRERVRVAFRANQENALKDVSVLERFFSFVSKSSNPAMRLIAFAVDRMRLNIVNEFYDASKDFLEKMNTSYDRQIIDEGTYYLDSFVDYAKHDAEKEAKQNEIVAELTGKELPDVVKLRAKANSIVDLLKDDTMLSEFNTKMREWEETTKISRENIDYKNKKKEKEDKLQLSGRTSAFLKNLSIRRSAIKDRVLDRATGTVDYSKLTTAEKAALDDIRRLQLKHTSISDRNGEDKIGLASVAVEKLNDAQKLYLTSRGISLEKIKPKTELIVPTIEVDSLENESRLALDLNLRNYYFQFGEDVDSREASYEKFFAEYERIEKIEGKAAAFEWASQNMSVNLSDKYYDKISKDSSYADAVQKYLNEVAEGAQKKTVQANFDAWKKLNRQRRDLLRQNRKLGSSLDVSVNTMPASTRLKLLEIEEEMQRIKNKLIKLPEGYETEATQATIVELSQDFYDMATERGMNEQGSIWKFALEHMTKSRAAATNDFHREISEVMDGRRLKMQKYFETFVKELVDSGKLTTDPTKTTAEEIVAIATDEFAKANIASYMKRYTPPGFNEVMQQFKEGKLDLKKVMESGGMEIQLDDEQTFSTEDISFRPDYTWSETEETKERINPDYNPEAYYLQLTDAYLNMKTFDKYGITVDQYKSVKGDITKLTATKNIEAFEHLKNIISLRQKKAEIEGSTQTTNLYLRPQISQTLTEKLTVKGVFGVARNLGSNVRQMAKEIAQNREDEMLYGEELAPTLTTNKARVIPKYFQRRLQSSAELTDSITSAVLLELKEALVYKHRVETNETINNLISHISNQTFEQSGTFSKHKKRLIKGAASESLKMATEYQDHHIFGIQQATRMTYDVLGFEVNFTKVLQGIQKFSTFANLGFSPFVALTSGTTGLLNRGIYSVTQKDISKSSMRWAEGKAVSQMKGYLAGMGDIKTKSEMQIIFEFFGLEDIGDRISNSVTTKAGRILSESPYLMDKVANLVFKPQVVYGLMKDYRWVELEENTDETARQKEAGVRTKFMNFRQFKANQREFAKQKKLSITDAQIEQNWKNLENKSIYDYTTFKNGKLELEIKDGSLIIPDEYNRTLQYIGSRAQDLSMKVDGVIPEYQRVAAQRNIFTNAMLQHQSWFIILLSKKFQRQSFDFNAGRYEEGEYRTTYNFLKEVIKNWHLVETPRDRFKNLEDYQKEAIARSGLELGVVFLMLALGTLVLEGDDEDDTYLEDLARLIYLRNTSEMVTQTALGIPTAVKERVSSPVPMWNNIDFLLNLPTTVTEDVVINKETGATMNKALYRFYKLTPFRRYSQLTNLQEQISSFRYYNDPTLYNLGGIETKEEKQALKDETYSSGQLAYDNLRTN